MNPPMNGASNGPMNTVAEKTATARPRTVLLNMSAKTAATIANGEEPKRPAKKRHIRTVWRSLATATAMLKMANPKAAIIKGGFRPYNSEKGAHIYTLSARAGFYRTSISLPEDQKHIQRRTDSYPAYPQRWRHQTVEILAL